MEYQVGDTVRIIDDPSQAEEEWDRGMFQYKGREARIIGKEIISGKKWYELDIDPGSVVWFASDFVQEEEPEVDMVLFEAVIACEN